MAAKIQPPTSRLPPIAQIATFTTTALVGSVEYLQSLYRPHVRGSRRRGGHDDSEELDVVRSDAFERAYAIRWLTALIAHLDTHTPPTDHPVADTDALIQQAAALLATCAGVAAAGTIQRRFAFASDNGVQVYVDVTDLPLDNRDYGSVGAQTWGGACVLAEMIVQRPHKFGLGVGHDDGLRILELGAGTGLVGLTIAKHLSLHPGPTHPRATIVLTDFYPAVLDNLQSNIDANFPTAHDTIQVTSHPLDWSSFSKTSGTTPGVLSTPFDVVFGADIVYEAQHAVWIRDCLQSLLARPDSAHKEPMFHLVIPLRPTHTFESGTVEEVFGSKERVPGESHGELTIISKEPIACEAYGAGKDEDVEYVYYRIGWTQ